MRLRRIGKIGLCIVAVPLLFAVAVEVLLLKVWKDSETASDEAFAKKACSKPVSLEQLRRWSYVFEGIVVDKWTNLFPSFVRQDEYRFQVVRVWGEQPGQPLSEMMKQSFPREIGLEHWFISSYTYHSFELGRRYLVFARLDDAPPQLFAHRCLPVAEGADIPAMAAKLGPPALTYDEKDFPNRRPFWLPVAHALRLRLMASSAMGYWIGNQITGRERQVRRAT
jgi:hypothetical protein